MPEDTERRRHELGPELGAELRAARIAAGLGLRQTARLVGINNGYLSLLEAGLRAPSVDVAAELAEALVLEPELRARLLEASVARAGYSRVVARLAPADTLVGSAAGAGDSARLLMSQSSGS